jgi:O-antigen/teichoic acid export membrane protein
MYTKFKQLGKESVIYGLGRAVSKFIGFFLLPIYTRVFSPSDYGVMDVIATMITLGGIILSAGADSAMSYYFFKTEQMEDRRKTVTMTAIYLFFINTLVVMTVWLTAGKISTLAFGEPGFALYLRIGVLSIPFTMLNSVNLNLFRLRRRPLILVSLTTASLLLSIALNIYLVVVLRVGIVGVFWTQVITAVVFSAIGLFANREYIGRAFDWSRLVQLLRYGLPLVVGGLSMWSINYLDRYFLLRYSTLDEIGLYSVGARFASAVALVTTAFRMANLPFLYEAMSDKDAPLIYSRILTYFILLTSLICVSLSLFARPVLTLLTTEAYVNAYRVVALLAYSAVGYGLYQIVSVGLLVTKRTDLAGITTGAGAFFIVVFLFLLVPPLGIVGAALATLLTHVAVVVMKYVAAQHVYPIPYELGRVFRTLGLAGTVIGVGLFIKPQNLWIDSLIAFGLLAAFLAMMPAFSLLSSSEQRIILNHFQKLFGIAQRLWTLVVAWRRRRTRVSEKAAREE